MARNLIDTCDTALGITIILVGPMRLLDLLPDRDIIVGLGFSFIAAIATICMAGRTYGSNHG
jgi:hypothetical protein